MNASNWLIPHYIVRVRHKCYIVNNYLTSHNRYGKRLFLKVFLSGLFISFGRKRSVIMKYNMSPDNYFRKQYTFYTP